MADKPFSPLQSRIEDANGSFERMLRRFVRMTKDDGILSEVVQRRGFVKPCQQRRRKPKIR